MLIGAAMHVGFPSAMADDTDWYASTSGQGARVWMNSAQANQAARAGENPGVRYRYVSISYCANHPGDAGADQLCNAAFIVCANNAPEQGLGPAIRIFRQAEGTSDWEFRGISCFPDLIDDGPSLTMAMIVQAFHDTAFAVPQVVTQPKGDVTLVSLPTYYQVVWPQDGFEPGEVDQVDLLGYQVQIRPRLDAVVYHFGDGTSLGPTTDLGGPYPTGGVVHAYTSKGTFPARADATYGGQFRVNDGEWTDIPGTAAITGAETMVTVKESRARLVTDPHG